MLVFLLIGSTFLPSEKAWSQNAEPRQAESRLSYEGLAEVLENDALRGQLIHELRELAQEEPVVSTAEESPTTPEPLHDTEPEITGSTSEQWVNALQYFAYQLHVDLKTSWAVLKEVITQNPQKIEQIKRWRSPVFSLLIVIALSLVAYGIGRRVVTPLFTRLNNWAHQPPTHGHWILTHSLRFRKLLAVTAALLVDWSTIAAATLAGYLGVIGLTSTDSSSSSAFLSIQFLTAFVLVEGLKSLSRAVFSTRYEQLRLVPITSASAQFWNRWFSVIVTLGGYGLHVMVPLLNVIVSESVANVVSTVLAVGIYIYAMRVLWSKRHSVTATFLDQASLTQNAVMGTVLRIMGRLWAWVAMIYFTALLVVTQITHDNALLFMAQASAQTLLVFLIGGILSLLLSILANQRLHLSAYWQSNFPLLEDRLNSYVPALLRVIRLVIVVGMLLCIFDAWKLLNLKGWLLSAHGQTVLNTLIRVLVVLSIAALSWTLLASMIEHRLTYTIGAKIPTEREKTLLMLFKNALAIVIATLTALIVLSQIGIDIGPLIAGAGVVGLAVGFGAQKLVQDVITGVFIQLENGMNQNDVVEVAGLFGVVEKLTIRSVVIRTLDGGYHLVPFSSIDCVANHTRDYGYHHGEYLVSLRESVDDVMEHMRAAFADLKQDPEVADYILEDISIPGVTTLGSAGATIRVLIKTAPGMQWAVQRSFNRLLKQHFDAAGIEIPYPQTVVHFGRDKDGNSAPANIHMVDALAQNQRAVQSIQTKPEV